MAVSPPTRDGQREMPQMWEARLDNGARVLSALRARGCTLALSATGRLCIEPPIERLHPLYGAIQEHLPYLLVHAALGVVARLLKPHQEEGSPLPAIDRAVTGSLYSISAETDITTARAAVVAYVNAWRGLVGEEGESHE